MTPLATLLIACEKIVSTKHSSMGYVEWRCSQTQFHIRLSCNNLKEHWNQSSLGDHEWNTIASEHLGWSDGLSIKYDNCESGFLHRNDVTSFYALFKHFFTNVFLGEESGHIVALLLVLEVSVLMQIDN
jgi:hypothetical protein